MDSENDETPKSYKRIKLWSDDDTQLLLDLYGGYLFQIGPMKKFRNKKEMWAKISTKIPDKSAKQCEERFKTVLRRKKKTKIDTGKKTDVPVWSDDDTQLLLDLCGDYLFQIGPMKKFKNKKEMWSNISTKIPDKNAKQCEERFKTVLRRKNTKIDPDKKTEQINAMALGPDVQFSIENIALEPEVEFSIENISLEPDVKLSIESIEENNECTMATLTVQETLWEIAVKNEVANERRHKEKMKAMEKMTALLQKILEKKGEKVF